MIFAELVYDIHYSELHEELVEYICSHFDKVESGLQGDSWIWIFDGKNEGVEKVAIDTFSAMKHQVKADTLDSVLAGKVITVLKAKYTVRVYDDPELEGHEDF